MKKEAKKPKHSNRKKTVLKKPKTTPKTKKITVKHKMAKNKTKKKVIKGKIKKRVVVKQKIKKKVIKKKTEKKRRKRSSISIFKKIGRILKTKKTEKKDELKSGCINRLNKLKREKITITTSEELNHLFRIFLREKYKIKEHLTVEEIRIKLQKNHKRIKTRILYVLIKTQDIEYSESPITKEELDMLVKEIIKIVKRS
jgi:hypothetical protein